MMMHLLDTFSSSYLTDLILQSTLTSLCTPKDIATDNDIIAVVFECTLVNGTLDMTTPSRALTGDGLTYPWYTLQNENRLSPTHLSLLARAFGQASHHWDLDMGEQMALMSSETKEEYSLFLAPNIAVLYRESSGNEDPDEEANTQDWLKRSIAIGTHTSQSGHQALEHKAALPQAIDLGLYILGLESHFDSGVWVK